MGIILIGISACVSSGTKDTDSAETTTVTEAPPRAIPGFVVKKPSAVPSIDGKIGKTEWQDAVMYPLGYNQLNLADQRPPMDQNDISGDWTVLYD